MSGPELFRVEVTVDRPTSGMWHCGPNPSWVTVTHIPTMTQARAYHRSQHKAREAAMACVQMMLGDLLCENDQCSFPEAVDTRTPLPPVTAPQGVDDRETALWDLLEEIDAQIDLAEEISPEFADKVQIALWSDTPAQPALTPKPVDDSLAADPAVKPTLAEALTVPEVKALVEAAQDAREVFEEYGSKAREAIDYMEQVALAALRQIGGEA